MHFLIIKKQYLFIAILLLAFITAGSYWLLKGPASETAALPAADKAREIHMVTGEFSAADQAGKKIESYRWDPGTILLEKNEKANLIIYGVNGKEHPFIIEGTGIKGTVTQGKETVVPLQFAKEGVYRLICLTHPDKNSNGPMIAYIVVD